MRGGWDVSFIIKSEQETYLDFYAIGDHYSKHKRIKSNGEIEELENFLGQFGRPIYPDDSERTEREHREIQNHNDKVYAILKAKGLAK
jgi:hypothetical protein